MKRISKMTAIVCLLVVRSALSCDASEPDTCTYPEPKIYGSFVVPAVTGSADLIIRGTATNATPEREVVVTSEVFEFPISKAMGIEVLARSSREKVTYRVDEVDPTAGQERIFPRDDLRRKLDTERLRKLRKQHSFQAVRDGILIED